MLDPLILYIFVMVRIMRSRLKPTTHFPASLPNGRKLTGMMLSDAGVA
jgi:hypothetical protein